MIAMGFFFCSSSVCKSENHHFDFKVCPLHPPTPAPLHYFALSTISLCHPPTLAAPPPQTAVPCGCFPPSVSLMQMFSLVTKPRGEFAA